MAHFAELDADNTVTRVVVVNNNDILNDAGVEDELLGVGFLRGLFGAHTRWKQTSYNAAFRGKFAGIGDTYDSTANEFVRARPYPSWTWDESARDWQPPIPRPTGPHRWDEQEQQWLPLQ